jgi:hypothetical protein
MTDDITNLRKLLGKSAAADLLREMIGYRERLWEARAGAVELSRGAKAIAPTPCSPRPATTCAG